MDQQTTRTRLYNLNDVKKILQKDVRFSCLLAAVESCKSPTQPLPNLGGNVKLRGDCAFGVLWALMFCFSVDLGAS